MYKIDYEKLGIYIGKKATEYFGRFYSKDIADYENEIVNANEIYNEINDYYKCSIELAEVGKGRERSKGVNKTFYPCSQRESREAKRG